MTTETIASGTHPQQDLLGQTLVVIGGSSGIGLETARRARTHSAEVILAGRNAGRVQSAGLELNALSTAVFDATDTARVEEFFQDLTTPIDHVMVTAGSPLYGRVPTWTLPRRAGPSRRAS